MIVAATSFAAVFLLVAAVSDAVSGAFIGGLFAILNSVLLTWLHRKADRMASEQKQVRDVLTAPRRIIYDANGNPVGTVMDLDRAGGWDEWLSHSRRAEDPPVPPAIP